MAIVYPIVNVDLLSCEVLRHADFLKNRSDYYQRKFFRVNYENVIDVRTKCPKASMSLFEDLMINIPLLSLTRSELDKVL